MHLELPIPKKEASEPDLVRRFTLVEGGEANRNARDEPIKECDRTRLAAATRKRVRTWAIRLSRAIMGHQRLSRALSGSQWHSPAAVVVEPYLAKEIARGVVYLERLILGVCVVEDFEPEGVPDEGGNQRRQSERHSSEFRILKPEAYTR